MIDNLILNGAGEKGFSCLGALMALDDMGVYSHIKQVSGSFGSGLMAMFVGLGYRVDEIHQIINNVDILDIIDPDNNFWVPGKFKNQNELLKFSLHLSLEKNNVFCGEIFHDIVRSFVARSLPEFGPNATFKDLKKSIDFDMRLKGYSKLKNMIFSGINLHTGKIEYFSANNPSCLDMPIASAVRITMSYPGSFECINWNGNFYVADNLGDAFPTNNLTSILRINIDNLHISTSRLVLKSFLNDLGIQFEKPDLHKQKISNLVKIFDEDNLFLEFSLSDEKKQKLINSGKNAIADWALNKKFSVLKMAVSTISSSVIDQLNLMLSLIYTFNDLIELEKISLTSHDLIEDNILKLLEVKYIEDIVLIYFDKNQDIFYKMNELENKLRITKEKGDGLAQEYIRKIIENHDKKNEIQKSFILNLKDIEELEEQSIRFIYNFVLEVANATKCSNNINPSTAPLPASVEEIKDYLQKNKTLIEEEIASHQAELERLKFCHSEYERKLTFLNSHNLLKKTSDEYLILGKELQKTINQYYQIYSKIGSWPVTQFRLTCGTFNWLMRLTPGKHYGNIMNLSRERSEQLKQAYLVHIHVMQKMFKAIQENALYLSIKHQDKLTMQMLKLQQSIIRPIKAPLSSLSVESRKK